MAGASDFTKMVPGFDFLQGLMKNAGAGLPQMNQWIAPTLDPEELDKRIQDLKTVQFWLEQNTRLLGTTIQALEVQRMTLSTLKTMNLPLAELGAALKLKMPAAEPAPAPAPAPATSPAAAAEASAPAPRGSATSAKAEPAAGGVDPLQWWGALTQQFSEIAAQALKDTGADAARHMASALVKQSIDSAGQTLKQATGSPVRAAGKVAVKATKAAAGVAKAVGKAAAPRRRRA